MSRALVLNVKVFNKTRKFAGHTIKIVVKENSKIEDVKAAIEEKTDIPSDIQYIVFGVHNLKDEERISDYHIRDEYTIYSVPTYIEVQELPNL